MKNSPKIRLFCEAVPAVGQTLDLPEKAVHYLLNVMKLGRGDTLLLFDNRHGEFAAEITETGKKLCRTLITEQTAPFSRSPDIWLVFAPVKKDKTDFIIEKSAELGVRKLQPVITARTISEKVRADRYQAQAVEACEQCRRVDLPEIGAAQPLAKLLQNWDSGRILFLMDESGQGAPVAEVFKSFRQQPAAILVGPEGGFSPEEFACLRACPFVRGISLGPRILRAETAAAAALACWQTVCGDWQ